MDAMRAAWRANYLFIITVARDRFFAYTTTTPRRPRQNDETEKFSIFYFLFFVIHFFLFSRLRARTCGYTCDSFGCFRHEHRTSNCVSSHSHCGRSHRLSASAALSNANAAAATATIVHHRNGVIVRGPSVSAGHRRRSPILGPPPPPLPPRRRRVRPPFTALKTDKKRIKKKWRKHSRDE